MVNCYKKYVVKSIGAIQLVDDKLSIADLYEIKDSNFITIENSYTNNKFILWWK